MKPRLAVLTAVVAGCVFGQLPAYRTQVFPGPDPGEFSVNGGSFPTGSVLTNAGNVSLISNVMSVTTSEYEVRTTYQIQASGGSFVTYLRANPTAQLGGSGTFYAMELSNIAVASGSCTASVTLWRVENGVHQQAASVAIGCRDGMWAPGDLVWAR